MLVTARGFASIGSPYFFYVLFEEAYNWNS
jgi:hypothetical protein